MELAAGRDPTELPTTAAGDLMDALCEGINMLTEEVVSGRRSMRMWSDELEQRIHERTTELQAHKHQLALIVENSTDAILSCDATGHIVSWNAGADRMFGYSAGEAIGRPCWFLAPDDVQTRQEEIVRRLLLGEQVEHLETRQRHQDGRIVHVSMSLSPLRDPQGKIAGFSAILRDVSHTVAERAMLRHSESRHRAVLNLLRIGSLELDEDGTVVFASAVCARLLQPRDPQLVGRRWDEVLPLDAETSAKLGQLLASPTEQRNPIFCRWESGGQRFWAELEVRIAPEDPRRRVVLLYDVTELERLRLRLGTQERAQLVGDSAPMQELYRSLEQVAQGNWTVLIEGETGSGKELVARSIHAMSPRAAGPFVAVNCAGLTESLLASQLFGHRKGAFTGAATDQVGLFESAAGGTLFLDEIGDIPPNTQVVLLRALQEREIIRVGDARARSVDVRVLVATHHDLEAAVRRGQFREDLLYRIRVARIQVPPLRARMEDLGLLSSLFIAQARLESGKPVVGLAPEAAELMQRYGWPGNVRELKNAIDHAVIRTRGQVLQVDDLPPELHRARAGGRSARRASGAPGGAPIDERQEILRAIRMAAGHKKRAAALLGVSRATLYRRLKQHGIGS